MKIYEQSLYIPKENINCESPYTMIDDFKNYIWSDIDFNRVYYNKKILRFIISNSYNSEHKCDLLVAESSNNKFINNLFNINPSNAIKNIDNFNVVLLIPTGIDCEIGGHAGDANSVARLIAYSCDTLITHPNVVNASDINELPDNGLYVEGSVIHRLISGMIGLKRVRSNKILLIMEEHENEIFNNEIVNTVSAARTTGIDCDIYVLEKGMLEVKSYYNKDKPSGYINNINPLINVVNKYKNEYDAFAIITNTMLSPDMHINYFNDNKLRGCANPWGAVEAMLTHTISELCNIISAHAPMDENEQISKDIEKIGIVDPRKAAETYSATSLYCILKGLYKAPHITNNFESIMSSIEDSDITVKDISCMIIPYRCLGLTILIAMCQQIPIIAVKENTNLMDNHYPIFKDDRYNNLIVVDTYLEAVGAMQCLKEGISLESVKRPLQYTKILNRK